MNVRAREVSFQLTFSISSQSECQAAAVFLLAGVPLFALSHFIFISSRLFRLPRTKGCIPGSTLCAFSPTFCDADGIRLQKSARCENSLRRCSRSEGNTVLTRAQTNSTHRDARSLIISLAREQRETLPGGSRHIHREDPLTWKFTRNNTHTEGKNCPRPFTSATNCTQLTFSCKKHSKNPNWIIYKMFLKFFLLS
jgi:hypothetical protein